VSGGSAVPVKRWFTYSKREMIDCYIFMAPAILGLLFFMVGPIIASAFISFTEYDILGSPKWIGFENYEKLMADPLFWKSLKTTLIYAFVSVPLGLIVSLLLALLLNQHLKGIFIFRTIYYLPAVMSGVAVALLWKWIFNPDFGLLNWFLSLFGVEGPKWLFSEQWALPAIIIMSLWGVGGSMLIYLAGLQGIPSELYEAAEIDGAGNWKQFIHVTVPMLSPVIFFNLVIGVRHCFRGMRPLRKSNCLLLRMSRSIFSTGMSLPMPGIRKDCSKTFSRTLRKI
jgi:multiple sugar transport system permease protein